MYSSAAPLISKKSSDNNLNDVRRSVAYHPTVWGDHFLSYTSQNTDLWDAEETAEYERQKEKVKILFEQTPDDSRHKIQLIDAIQRLGVGYLFEKEIEESLQQIHEAGLIHEDDDLSTLALRFRLLRQQGYRVPSEIFEKFIENEKGGCFKDSMKKDDEGMLQLYEASYYGVQGEQILDKALEFSCAHLKSLVLKSTTKSSLAKRVGEALKCPISKSLNRLMARKFIPIYQEDEKHNEILLNFAKLDFNKVQKLYQRELGDITRWWKYLDFANKLPFARDRVVECYFWIVGVFFEPQYATARKMLTKVIYMAAVIDDIYDIHGTLDELHLFTNIVRSWDVNVVDDEDVPPYIGICFKALSDIYVEMEAETGDQSYRTQYAIEEIKRLANSYYEEAKWSYSKYMPTMDEYMKLALVSCGYMMMIITSLVGIKDVTKEDFDWVLSEPLMVRASLTICRLMDDLVGYVFEQKVSAINCYMRQNGASEIEALTELGIQVKNAWKDINEQLLEPKPASMSIHKPILNLTRVINVLYSDEDGFSNSKTKTKELITIVLVEPLN